MTVKLHLLDPEADDFAREMRTSICGWTAVEVTEDPALITCMHCRRIWHKRHHERDRVRITFAEALRDIAAVISGPRLVAHPELEPEAWASMRCRQGMAHCSCGWCQADKANARAKQEWSESQQVRPHRRYGFPFGSINAALELLLRWKADGVSARSSQGSLQSRAQETARLGAAVQTTVRTDREDLTTKRATQAVDIEHAVRFAYAETGVRRGQTADVCGTILLDSVDPEGRGAEWWAERLDVSESSVRGIIRHGRKQATRWLADQGYIPEPRAVKARTT